MSDLEQYRQEIDELDEQLVRLFLRRMEVTGKVGEYKLAHGMQVLDRERERRVLAKRASLAVDIRQEEDVKELFQTIMAISRRRQQELIDRSGTGTVRKTNVVLIGMPGSGKSCVGAALAERLGMPLVETDAMVVEKTGRSIPDIFAQDGEAAFRREETAAARRAAAMEDGHLHRRRDHPPTGEYGDPQRHRHRLFPGPGPQGHRQHGAGRPAPAQRGAGPGIPVV